MPSPVRSIALGEDEEPRLSNTISQLLAVNRNILQLVNAIAEATSRNNRTSKSLFIQARVLFVGGKAFIFKCPQHHIGGLFRQHQFPRGLRKKSASVIYLLDHTQTSEL